jgi:hypothetical protein
MPNWVHNNLTVSGDKEELAKLKAQVGAQIAVPTKEYVFDAGKKIVRDAEGNIIYKDTTRVEENPVFAFWNITQPSADQFENYRSEGWYNWNLINWGTKWDVAGSVEVHDESDDYWRITFETAWSNPEQALTELSRQYPTLTIYNEWQEEQGFGAHEGYLAGEKWCDKEWDIPGTHEESEDVFGEGGCPCAYMDTTDGYPFEDCPGAEDTTRFAVAQLEKISELI